MNTHPSAETIARIRRDLWIDGYALLRSAVPDEVVRRARRKIDARLDGRLVRDAQAEDTSYCPELREDPDLLALCGRGAIQSVIDRLLTHPLQPRRAQIALRFRSDGPREIGPPHIDGFPHGQNTIPADTVRPFFVLAGVWLSDVTQPFAGNFTVFPGTHLLNHGRYLAEGLGSFAAGRSETGARPPIQLEGRAGDAVICHYYLGHTPAPNLTEAIRYAAFFRLGKEEAQTCRDEILSRLWFGWNMP